MVKSATSRWCQPSSEGQVYVNVSLKASAEELAELSDAQRAAFLQGVSNVIGMLKRREEA